MLIAKYFLFLILNAYQLILPGFGGLKSSNPAPRQASIINIQLFEKAQVTSPVALNPITYPEYIFYIAESSEKESEEEGIHQTDHTTFLSRKISCLLKNRKTSSYQKFSSKSLFHLNTSLCILFGTLKLDSFSAV